MSKKPIDVAIARFEGAEPSRTPIDVGLAPCITAKGATWVGDESLAGLTRDSSIKATARIGRTFGSRIDRMTLINLRTFAIDFRLKTNISRGNIFETRKYQNPTISKSDTNPDFLRNRARSGLR